MNTTTSTQAPQVGDAVQHRTSGQVAVVVAIVNRRQVAVQATPGTSEVWYTANLTAC